MEKMQEIGKGLLAFVVEGLMVMACLALLGSLLTAMSGCDSAPTADEKVVMENGDNPAASSEDNQTGLVNQPGATTRVSEMEGRAKAATCRRIGCLNSNAAEIECQSISIENVQKALGKEYKTEEIGDVSFIVNSQGKKFGFARFEECNEPGRTRIIGIPPCCDGLSLDGHTPVVLFDNTDKRTTPCCGVSVEYAEQKLVFASLGEGYALHTAGVLNYIRYGGQTLTGGHHSFFMKDGVIYGRLGATIDVVRTADRTFLSDNGAYAVEQTQHEKNKELLRFLGNGYSIRYLITTQAIQFDKQNVTDEFQGFTLRDGKIYGYTGTEETEVLQNRPKLEPAKLPKSDEPTLTDGAPCTDIFDTASTIKCETACKCMPNQAIVDNIEKQLPDSPALQTAWKILELGSNKGTSILGTSCMMEGGGFGSWVDAGLDKPVCLHMPERGGVAYESPVGQPCTTSDNQPGKLENDWQDDGTKYKLGHGYKCVPLRRGF